MRERILFVTWDGPQVSYLETLFLPIFRRLAGRRLDFHILQFTWGDANRIAANEQACAKAGFTYHSVTIWRRHLAVGALLTAIRGARLIRQAVSKHQIDIVMPRSTLPAFATLLALRGTSLPMIFDADGLPLDERVDFGGLSATGPAYRILREIEARAVRRADVVLTRSAKAVGILQGRAGPGVQGNKFQVVHNGRDQCVFVPGDDFSRKNMRRDLGIEQAVPLLVYAGSLGPQYCLPEMLRLFSFVHERNSAARLLVLTSLPNLVPPALESYPHLESATKTMRVDAGAVPQYLACADLGLALRRSSFSMQAVAPIKLGEYLLCGLPVVASDGIGDTSMIVDSKIGFLIKNMDDRELTGAANWFVDVVLADRAGFRDRCRDIGVSSFSLDSTVEDYRRAVELATT